MRLEVSRRADLAVRALQLLEGAGARVKADALAEALDSTPGFVPQFMGPLVKHGWVRSNPGPSGGYSLVSGLDALSVLDVVEAIDGPTDAGRCVVADRRCASGPPCAMHLAWSRARTELNAALSATTIAELSRPAPSPATARRPKARDGR